MTVPERLSAHLVSIQLSRRRAPARNAEVRSNSDHDCHDSRSKVQNGSAFRPGTGVRAPRTVAPRPCSTIQVICRPLKSHR
jgi:hypothetical protein